ncbi:MAG: BamA/TamA family outer membrane protein [Bacteroidetes bacterium]|nr:BamA/TamA family outer membrane protein [Bacteroidota bacterium]
MKLGVTAFILVILFLIPVSAYLQSQPDSLKLQKKEERIEKKKKKGWGWIPFPSVLYNTDIGFQFGGLVEIYNYKKNRPIFPDYYHKFYAEVSFTTKGGSIFQVFYDSRHLIKNIRTTADVTYLTEQALDFYGFNGYKSVYNHSWEDDRDTAYISRMFYRQERKFLRVAADFQGKFFAENLRWLAGLAYLQIVTDSVDIARLNKGKKEKNKLPDTSGLFSHYETWNILSPKERNGGMNNYIKLGLIYDSRDNEPCPMKGIWSEVIFILSPGFLGDGDYSFLRLAVNHRQYFTLVRDHLSFAYRIGYIGTIAGKAPYYVLPYQINSYSLTTTVDGIGGSQTVRGILRNRVVGDGMAWMNAEFRWKFWHFRFLRSDWYLAANVYGDAGMVVQERPVSLQDIPADINRADYFSDGPEYPHVTIGGGLHLAINRNTVIAAEIGKAINKQDGNIGIYVGIGWLF